MQKADVVVVGGGFYGCCLALFMRGYVDNVVLLEKEDDLLKRASAINQARVHTGYHYPRSFVTAYRSFVNFPRFVLDFRKAVIGDFTKVYAIARNGSKVNARRFHDMFRQMGAKISVATPKLQSLFNQDLIEGAFLVEEMAFDAVILRAILKEKLARAGVKVLYRQEAEYVEQIDDDRVKVCLKDTVYNARYVFNCTYTQINKLLKNSRIDFLPFKHELTEMALIEAPDDLKNIGITVMDGPFFSSMPYPSRGLHSLSHVRYTPHYQWSDLDGFMDGHKHLEETPIVSKYSHMIRDVQRYIPVMSQANYVESLYEIKTVLLQNEQDDGRPILFKQNHGLKNFSTIMGGKIDNIYDVLEMIGEAKESLSLKKDVWRYLFPGRNSTSVLGED